MDQNSKAVKKIDESDPKRQGTGNFFQIPCKVEGVGWKESKRVTAQSASSKRYGRKNLKFWRNK